MRVKIVILPYSIYNPHFFFLNWLLLNKKIKKTGLVLHVNPAFYLSVPQRIIGFLLL